MFGTIGASVMFNKIESDILGKSLVIIAVGLIFRWFATFFATAEKKYTIKERMFMAFAWMPKATVQAAIGGVVFDMASSQIDSTNSSAQ